jgi:hypothetical protein
MQIPDPEKVMRDLEELLPAFSNALNFAFARYFQEYPASVRADHDTTTQANCIYDHILARVQALLEGRKGVRFILAQGLTVLVIRTRYAIKFKKLQETGVSSNVRTEQSNAFDQQGELAGMPPRAIHLKVGYVPDSSNTLIERMLVVCPNGQSVAWAQQFGLGEAADQWAEVTKQRPLFQPSEPRIRTKTPAKTVEAPAKTGIVVSLRGRK